ncbi:MAG: gamma-glutamyltransferase [Intrasporangium sp.]|uniref:gamma-glutamyltransferase n=1 Tax=Intrasporangium sp. TaxID=1925024 RepID=UPI003F7FB6D2
MSRRAAAPGAAGVAVAATSVAGRDAGLAVVRAGGNAVDAAIATALVAMSTEPGVVSLMGGAFVNIWPADGDPELIDGNVEMPGRGAGPERFGAGVRRVVTAYGGGVTMYAAHGSVANSGAIQALALARDRHGALPWADLVAPAAAICRDGYPLGGAAATYLEYVREPLFGEDAEALRVVSGPDGRALAPGEMTRNEPLADVLDQLGTEGPALFTTGDVGKALVADMAANGGLVTAEDLVSYEPIVRIPLQRRLGEWIVALNPPPSIGGPLLGVMLGELVRRGTSSWRDVIEIQRAVLTYRHEVHDLSRDLERDGLRLLAEVERYGLAGLPTSASTAHVSAVDSDGTACAITFSAGYGAGVTIPGTGILLNNCLGEPELNRLGLHTLTPGTRLASNMAPTTARRPDGTALAIGSPGADRITTALMQVLGRVCLRGEGLVDAISAPRVHVSVGAEHPLRVDYEDAPAIDEAVAALRLEGNAYPGPHMYFGGVGAACRWGTAGVAGDGTGGGGLEAAGDLRRAAAVGTS